MFISSRTGNKRDIGLSETLSTPLESNDKFKVEEGESHKERTIMQCRRDEPGNVGGKLKNVLESAQEHRANEAALASAKRFR